MNKHNHRHFEMGILLHSLRREHSHWIHVSIAHLIMGEESHMAHDRMLETHAHRHVHVNDGAPIRSDAI